MTATIIIIAFIWIIVSGGFVADYWQTKSENKKLKRAFKSADSLCGFQKDLINELTPKRDRKGRFVKR